ncbi:site-specific integrase [bacterium]|nr:site-specific integrase [bacterium]
MIHCWAILQALSGVRLYEAAYLREQDINPQAGTITITETPVHKPKTRYSYREIPISAAAMEALTAWIKNMKVRHPGGYLFFPYLRKSGRKHLKTPEAQAGVFTVYALTHFWGEAHRAAKAGGIKLPSKFIPRKLRATFVTHLRKAGADFSLLESYIGHAPKTILAAHYDHIDMDRLRTLANLAQDL